MAEVTRDMVERAVAGLFVNGNGDRATRLALVDDSRPANNLGGLCQGAVADRLCEAFGLDGPACEICGWSNGVVPVQQRIRYHTDRFEIQVRHWCLACRKRNKGTYRRI